MYGIARRYLAINEETSLQMMTAAQSATYIYDGDGNLVKSIVNEVVTYYVGRHYHKTVDGANVTVKKYYAIGMSQIAVRTIEGASDTLNWILTDHLSSASVIAYADGTLVSEVKYSAFGEIRSGSGEMPTDYRYTGQLSQMAEVGLYHYGARFYDPALSHFVSADTIVPGAGNVLDFNRYAYVRYNPLAYVDLSGNSPECGPDGLLCDPFGNLLKIATDQQQLQPRRRFILHPGGYFSTGKGREWLRSAIRYLCGTGFFAWIPVVLISGHMLKSTVSNSEGSDIPSSNWEIPECRLVRNRWKFIVAMPSRDLASVRKN